MKATTYYCDRCANEGKPKEPAPHKAWIRTSLGGRALRVDVCEAHLLAIVGTSSNGARPVPAAPSGERIWSTRGGQGLERKAYERLAPFVEKRPRFSIDDARAYLGKDVPPSRIGRALRLLVDDGKLERYMASIYQRPGFTIPEPASAELAATAVVKLAKAQPGMRATAAAALAGIESVKLWRATIEYIREHKLARTKGSKSAMCLYAL